MPWFNDIVIGGALTAVFGNLRRPCIYHCCACSWEGFDAGGDFVDVSASSLVVLKLLCAGLFPSLLEYYCGISIGEEQPGNYFCDIVEMKSDHLSHWQSGAQGTFLVLHERPSSVLALKFLCLMTSTVTCRISYCSLFVELVFCRLICP